MLANIYRKYLVLSKKFVFSGCPCFSQRKVSPLFDVKTEGVNQNKTQKDFLSDNKCAMESKILVNCNRKTVKIAQYTNSS